MTLFKTLITTILLTSIFNNVLCADDNFVSKPNLPDVHKPSLKEGESKEAFSKRVLTLHFERKQEVFPIQKEYRMAVEDRNRRLLSSEKKQNPNLLDANDPLFLAYRNIDMFDENSDELTLKLKTKQAKFNENRAWLFIIAIEDYEKTDPVLFATRTATLVEQTFQKKLNISKRNIITLLNKEANLKNINVQLRKLLKRVQRNDIIYFYYCGHGVSNKKGEEFILPYDGDPEQLNRQNTINIERVYNKFLNSKALRTFSFVDASYNGITDAIALKKGIVDFKMRPRPEGYHKRINILNSARAQDTSNGYYAKGYRLFSYFLAKEVLSKPQNAGELFDSIRTKIREVSIGYGQGHLQEPEFFGYRELSIQK